MTFEDDVKKRHALFLNHPLIKIRSIPIERTLKPKSQCLAEALMMREELEEDYVKQRDYLDGRIAEFREDQ